MIKKIIIRILSVIMLVAFIAVVSVQWIWIKYSIVESDARFRSDVYKALDRVVGYVEDIGNTRFFNEIKEQYDQIEQFNKQIMEQQDSNTFVLPQGDGSNAFFSINQTGGHGLVFSVVGLFQPNADNIMHQLMKRVQDETRVAEDSIAKQRLMDMLKQFVVRSMKENDPQSANVRKRLEGVELEPLVSEELTRVGIYEPFECRVMTEQQILDWQEEHPDMKGFYYTKLFPKDLIQKDLSLCVIFHSTSLFSKSLIWMFVASSFCIIGLMTVLIVTLVVITRQQKLSVIKNDFINNMTHEFKTPLATISLATSAIEKEKVLNDKTQLLKFNAMIKSENERMNKYVERILLQAKLDRLEIHLNKVEVNLNVLVDEAVEHFRLQVEERGGVIKEELDAGGYVMEADEVHMLNVVCNLIDNAIKYSHDVLDIYVFTRWEGNNFVIGVKDCGIGIPKEAQSKVFKRFYRVPSGNLHNVKGFGLGLSYVKSIVGLHGGEIRLTSKKGKGTLVEILFTKKM